MVLYKDQVSVLPPLFEDGIQRIKVFRDKYKGRPEGQFFSYIMLGNLELSMKTVIEESNLISKNFFDEHKVSLHGDLLGVYLGQYIHDLRTFVDNKELFWLSTQEDLEKERQRLEREMRKTQEERSRILEERIRKKQQ